MPPFSSGYSSADRRESPAFLDEVGRTHAELWAGFDAFMRESGAAGLANGPLGPEFIHESPYLNLYLYPAEADYAARATPLGPTWHRLDSCVRDDGCTWRSPLRAPGRDESSGAARLPVARHRSARPTSALMQRLVDVLARTTPSGDRQSKGPARRPAQPGRETWPARRSCRSRRSFRRSTSSITHGGNNTVTECVPPRQADGRACPCSGTRSTTPNAWPRPASARRLPAYAFEPDELTGAIDAPAR